MDWMNLLGKVAPVLGGAVGGPFGAMAGKWLGNKLGVPESELESTISNADPELMAKIKGLDNEFKLEMKKLGLAEKQLHSDDRDSARDMAVNTSLTPQIILATVFVFGFMGILYLVFSGSMAMADNQKDMANYLLGILSAGLVQIMNFFFGSSAGSKEKTAKLK